MSELPQTTQADLADDAVLLDVREDDEWGAGRAPQAVHIPLGELPQRLDDLPAQRPLAVVCRSGGRSARATQFLLGQGVDAINVSGGMQAWASAGRPMTRDGAGAPEVA